MARFVVLEFEDNNIAEQFTGLVDGSTLRPEDVVVSAMAGAHATIAAVYAKPTVFCTCPVEYSTTNFAKSKTFGWFVHIRCKKPTKNWGGKLQYILGQAKDLLPAIREKRDASQGNEDGSSK